METPGTVRELSLQANVSLESGQWACLAKLVLGTCFWITLLFLGTTEDEFSSVLFQQTFCWEHLYRSELSTMLPADYYISAQLSKFTVTSALLFCWASKLNRPFSRSVSVFLTLEAKFNFLEGHFHYSLSWDNPWKTREALGVPNSFPFPAFPADTRTLISPLLLMLPLPAPDFSLQSPGLGSRRSGFHLPLANGVILSSWFHLSEP